MKKLYLLFSILVVAYFAGCGNNSIKNITDDSHKIKNNLVNVNKTLVSKEDDDIENYIERHEWTMNKTGTGLRYQIYFKGNGAQPKGNEKVIIKFVVNLINGTECYNSKNDGLKLFELGKAEVENGLEEGIMLMHVGDRAKMIIPSHLAYGLLGDENKIPKRATLIYDVELKEIKEK
ncbi:MAG: FKBP-type peptidyl-prolyl cis-trans isomerase [Bacteroidota bacterium]